MNKTSDVEPTSNYKDYGTCKINLNCGNKDNIHIHQIQPGDTLMSVAIKYNVSIGSIKQCNGMFSSEIGFLRSLRICLPPDSAIDSDSPEAPPPQQPIQTTPDLIREASHAARRASDVTLGTFSPPQDDNKQDFLRRMDLEICRAKSNLSRLNERSQLKEQFYADLSHSQSNNALVEERSESQSSSSRYRMGGWPEPEPLANRAGPSTTIMMVDVKVRKPAAGLGRHHPHEHYNDTFRDSFFEL